MQRQKTVTSAPNSVTIPARANKAAEVAQKIKASLMEPERAPLPKGLQLLADLADYLDTVPDDGRFDMELWGALGQAEHTCGFRGCAIGWGVHGNLLKGHMRITPGGGLHLRGPDGWTSGWDWSELGDVFGISERDAYRCFDSEYPGRDDTPKGVAKTIREVVERTRPK